MPANVEAFLEEFGLLHIENLKWFRDVDFNPLEAIGINLDAEYFENLLDEYDIIQQLVALFLFRLHLT